MTSAENVRAFGWDPTNPSLLWLPNGSKMNTLHAYEGAGCNEHELSALLKLLTAHDEFHRVGTKSADAFRGLFQSYRAAVTGCLSDWTEALNKKKEQQQDADEQNEESFYLELLKINYAVLHLSDVFLPLLPSKSWDRDYFYQDPYSVPGLATADTVRYLRYNHTADVEQEDPRVAAMMEAAQPERYCDDDDDTGQLYWRVVTKLVLRGCLEQAWHVLSKHSLYVAAISFNAQETPYSSQTDPQYAATMRDVERGFLVLRDILLRAPLPAGRTDAHDNDLDWTGEDASETARYMLDDLEVSATDFKFWEPSNRSSVSGDLPLDFQADAAKRKHQQWQGYVQELRRSSFPIQNHVPEIKSILDVLSGDLRGVRFESWAEKLLAELLYRQPDIRPRNLSTRARHIANELGEERKILKSMLNIMEGNAGDALELVFDYGAAAGAALPAALLALLFSLFLDATILPSSEAERKADFLCHAAWAIQSSLTQPSVRDMGIQQAVRLLLPYAMSLDSCGERVRAAIAQILEHYEPSAKHFAETLISQCRPLIERKSLQILDACASVLLSLHRRQMYDGNVEAATLTLLAGMELEALVLPDASLGMCYRKLCCTCLGTADDLMKSTLGDVESKVDSYSIAKAISVAFEQHNTARLQDMPEAMLLGRTVSLVDAMVSSQYQHAIDQITEALSQDRDPSSGNRILRNMQWHYLRAAQLIMEATGDGADPSQGAFDKEGALLLMETLTKLTTLSSKQKECPYSTEQVIELEKCLTEILARAIVADNARKKGLLIAMSRPGRDGLDGIQAPSLRTYRMETQERYVQDMLDFA